MLTNTENFMNIPGVSGMFKNVTYSFGLQVQEKVLLCECIYSLALILPRFFYLTMLHASILA